MLFRDRDDAAERLAFVLRAYQGKHPLVLAIPRGAVPMGRIIADALGGELNLMLVRKLGAPGNPELAVGAIDETGTVVLGGNVRRLGISSDYLQQEARIQLDVLRQRSGRYRRICPYTDPQGHVVIVIDDGIATGATMSAALQMLRQRAPQRIVLATPVAPADTLDHLRPLADEVICLETPENFYAIGQFYADFPQVSDEEVIACLRGPEREERIAS